MTFNEELRVNELKKFQIVKLLLGVEWRIFIGLMECGELRGKV